MRSSPGAPESRLAGIPKRRCAPAGLSPAGGAGASQLSCVIRTGREQISGLSTPHPEPCWALPSSHLHRLMVQSPGCRPRPPPLRKWALSTHCSAQEHGAAGSPSVSLPLPSQGFMTFFWPYLHISCVSPTFATPSAHCLLPLPRSRPSFWKSSTTSRSDSPVASACPDCRVRRGLPAVLATCPAWSVAPLRPVGPSGLWPRGPASQAQCP